MGGKMTEPQSSSDQEQPHSDAPKEPAAVRPNEVGPNLQAVPPAGHGNQGGNNQPPPNPPPVNGTLNNAPLPERRGLSITDWITAVSRSEERRVGKECR